MIFPALPSVVLPSTDARSELDASRLTTDRVDDTFGAIYDQHIDFAWRTVRRLGVSEAFADDVLQQVFLVVHRRLAEFEGRSSHKTWIFSIVLRIVRDHRRSMRRKSPHWFQSGEPVEPDVLTAKMATPLEEMERNEAMRKIDALLETLDDDKRTVFVLAELEQMTANEISEATGMSPRAVYSRLRAARTDFERAAARMRRADEGRLR